MNNADITVITEYLKKQSIKVVESLDFDQSTIKYTKAIKQNREIKNIIGGPRGEEIVRAILLTKLVNTFGYLPENIEIEKEYDIGRPKNNKPRVDVIVRDSKGNAFLFIEVKSPDEFEKNKDEVIEKQLFNLAHQEKGQGVGVTYLSLYSIDILEDHINDACIIIHYEKYNSFDLWKTERNYTNELPTMYGKAQKKPFIKGGSKDLESSLSYRQLESLRKNVHNVLWGGGGTDDNEVFASLTNLILAKIQDESERKNNEEYSFQIFTFVRENDENFETNDQIFDRINSLYRRALKQRLNVLNEKKLEVSYVIDRNKFSLGKLKYIVQELEKYSFVHGKNSLNGRDILGDFFEGIIREGFKQSKGQFFTHINVVKFLLWGLQLDKLAIDCVNTNRELPYFIDPSAGSGTFLIEYMKFITKNLKYRFKNRIDESQDIENKFHEWFMPDHRENKWAKDYIYGSEINFNLGTAIKVNMILHGDGSTNIFVQDGLLPFASYKKDSSSSILAQYETDHVYAGKEVNNRFDVLITNPPFSVSLDNDTKKNVQREFVFGKKKNSENLFIERWYQLLKPNGRFAAVLPESVFDTKENKYIRLFIYKYFKVKAIVSLPQITFEPYTSTKTSLLFAQKKSPEEIIHWNELWSRYSGEWSLLKTRCEKEVEHFINKKPVSPQWAISKEGKDQRKNNLLKLLKNHKNEADSELSLEQLVNKYQFEIKNLCAYDKDSKEIFGFVNTWWVFGEVVQSINYPIFMVEVENIGYKRSKKGEKKMPNELFRSVSINDEIKILVDDGIKETALDFLRDLQWD